MKYQDQLILAVKILLLLLWVTPAIVLLFFSLPSIISETSAALPLIVDLLTILFVILLACLPAIASSYALSMSSRHTSSILLFTCAILWLIPTTVYQSNSDSIALISDPFWHTTLQLWTQLFPFAVVGTLVLIQRIDKELFDLASYSQVPIYSLIYKYFFPLLTPGIWLLIALLTSLSPSLYYLNQSQAEAQLSHIILSLPLVLFIHKLDKYTSAS